MSLNPIVATILGVYLFEETLAGGVTNIVLMAISAVVIFIGIVWLSVRPRLPRHSKKLQKVSPGAAGESATFCSRCLRPPCTELVQLVVARFDSA